MLRDLIKRPFYAELKEGKHEAILTNWEYKAHETNPENDYITMTFMVDGENPYKRNMFERDISIMLSHVRRQLGRQHETIADPTAFFDELKTNKTKLNLWITYPVVATKNGMQRRQNLYFIEPASNNSAPEAEAADTAEEVPPTLK